MTIDRSMKENNLCQTGKCNSNAYKSLERSSALESLLMNIACIILSLIIPIFSANGSEEIDKQKMIDRLSDDFFESKDLSKAYFIATIYSSKNDLNNTLVWLKKLTDSDWSFGIEHEDFRQTLSYPQVAMAIEMLDKRVPTIHSSNTAFSLDIQDLFPESIAFNSNTNSFYVGSLKLNSIIEHTSTGQTHSFLDGSNNAIGAIFGIKFDKKENLLWILSNPQQESEKTASKQSELIAIDVHSKKITKRISGKQSPFHLLNDLCIMHGNIYFSDTIGSSVYRYNYSTEELSKLPFKHNIKYPNGIACDSRSNSLYIANQFGINYFSFEDGRFGTVILAKQDFLNGIDGLYFYDDSLVAIQNALGKPRVIRIDSPMKSTGASIKILESGNALFDIPTTGVIVDDSLFYIANSQISKMSSSIRAKPTTTILRIEL